jgi:hypothetical protein
MEKLTLEIQEGHVANPSAPDAGGRASGAHLVASGAPDFSPVKVAND